MTVRIVTDSASDLPASAVDDLGIGIVPLSIRFGDEELLDRVELSTAEFWRRCAAADQLPETAAPAPGQFAAMFRAMADDGATGILVVTISGALSATGQAAELAARDCADQIPVRVVDSRSVTLGEGMIVVACARAARAGGSLDELEALAQDLVRRTKVWGALDTLENLRKGGRIGNARALLASALAIKPIIEVRDGSVEQGGKQRTRSKALAFLADTVAGAGPIENLAVLHAQCDDVEQFVGMLAERYTGPILVGDIGPVVGTHAGRGTIGVAFQTATP